MSKGPLPKLCPNCNDYVDDCDGSCFEEDRTYAASLTPTLLQRLRRKVSDMNHHDETRTM